MHRVLEIPEILLIIFKYALDPPHMHCPPDIQRYCDLAALARMCRAFKEPALDVLWSKLGDFSSTVQCVLNTMYAESQSQQGTVPVTHYPALTQDEWTILRNYTRRIRVMNDCNFFGPASDPVPENFFGQDLLFPNLRESHLQAHFQGGVSPWIHQQHIPSLNSITIAGPAENHLYFLRDYITSLSEFYPNLTKITLEGHTISTLFKPHRSASSVCYTWPWNNLRVLDCHDFKLEADDLKHLSQLPSLVELTFALNNAEDVINALDSEHPVLVFTSLKCLGLSEYSQSLKLVSKFFAHVKLPAVKELAVHADGCLTKEVGPFLETIQAACNNDLNGPVYILQSFFLTDVSLRKMAARRGRNRVALRTSDLQISRNWNSQHSLSLEDLQPCMTFDNIRIIQLDVVGRIHLTDADILELTSAWPLLKHLSINEATGWNHPLSVNGGITLDCLQRLLLKCPLLSHVGLVVHTPDEAAPQLEMPITDLHARANLGDMFHINVMGSIIGDSSIPVITALLARLVGRDGDFKLMAWSAFGCGIYSDAIENAHRARWDKVGRTVSEILGRTWHGLLGN